MMCLRFVTQKTALPFTKSSLNLRLVKYCSKSYHCKERDSTIMTTCRFNFKANTIMLPLCTHVENCHEIETSTLATYHDLHANQMSIVLYNLVPDMIVVAHKPTNWWYYYIITAAQ